ncbi:glutamate--tRNA ligase [Candidatus Azobacteroides pseudotrichonymphae]|uniref:Glutamate--tRNA ligase n=1 Tax=Azobacteroides pseudotrichonymphae genomovar. CFP2 TaxID=511995 RepID=SYE_AZOPC|nr:glutamate--tRNA ligase [Candidatus Azobacteroides pseudotrichonymphae]B6YQF6.1 RecName: Full=Glutamate--tRNA ligase; AltName: Full=Glutamyl-tRNA synthetase; Short=GluRS [Candidatus Azobacteroides pseudotrichonymphae genomovar. CFP2]BAG83428.1 glutamyl-tRNA synthetase [Candidatus Azobacteroides pseudotrichonymphae genomovar. CFP2]
MKARVRFAPSPTGPLHIGSIRTALYNYLFAKKYHGDFILRIEDTDSTRFIPGAEEYIIETFKWLGITFDEGPYRQSERKAIYKEYVDELLNKNLAYIAFDTPEELEAKRRNIPNFQYDAITRMTMNNSLTLSKEETKKRIANSNQYVVRIKIDPNQTIIVNDLIRGEMSISSSTLDDKVLYKSSDNLPTYHLANIVDDHLMKITHVIRGEEWLSSTPLHIILYQYFGWGEKMPVFAHLPLLLKPDGKGKLSKRDGERFGFPIFPLQWTDSKTGKSISGYREDGYLPEALINFLALLGWNPGSEQEFFSIDELSVLFSLKKCSKNGAKFDYKKVEWFNHQYIQKKSDKEIAELFFHFYSKKLEKQDFKKITEVIGMVKGRISSIRDLWYETAFFFVAPNTYDEKIVQKRWRAESPIQLTELSELLATITNFSLQIVEKTIRGWINNKGYHPSNIMNACRLALVGTAKGPGIFHIIEILGKEEVIIRIKKAIQVLR